MGNEHPHSLNSINNLATLYHATDRYPLAEPLYLEALAGKRRVIGENHPNTLSGLKHLGRLYTDMGRFEEALPFFEQCLRGAEATLPEGHWYLGAWQVTYGQCLGRLRRYQDAEATLLKAHGILAPALKPDHPHVGKSIDRLIELYVAWRRSDESHAWRAKRATVPPTNGRQ